MIIIRPDDVSRSWLITDAFINQVCNLNLISLIVVCVYSLCFLSFIINKFCFCILIVVCYLHSIATIFLRLFMVKQKKTISLALLKSLKPEPLFYFSFSFVYICFVTSYQILAYGEIMLSVIYDFRDFWDDMVGRV